MVDEDVKMDASNELPKSKPAGRSDNWQANEKDYLISLIRQKIKVLENKKTDYHSNQAKRQAWSWIEENFKAKFGIKRDLHAMKLLWKRLKQNTKSEVNKYKTSIRRTGGGSPPPPVSSIATTIQEMIPNDFNSIMNPFDDDSTMLQENANDDDTIMSAMDYLVALPNSGNLPPNTQAMPSTSMTSSSTTQPGPGVQTYSVDIRL